MSTDACCALLKRGGHPVRRIATKPDGRIDPAAAIRAIRKDTALVTIIHAQNEIGTLQPVAEVARHARSVGAQWRLTLRGGPSAVVMDRAALAGMPQHTARLPIACVEGWSTTQTWSGVRLADLARRAGVAAPHSARVMSLQRGGAFGEARLQADQIAHPDALLALRVNGADLTLDHGYPARVIMPNVPGTLNTKWVGELRFEAA